jgi:alkaline phosphatase D
MGFQACILKFCAPLGIVFALLAPMHGHSQQASIVCSPIIGAQATHTAKVWTMVKDCKNVGLEVLGSVNNFSTVGKTSWQGNVPVTFDVQNIPLGSSVEGQLWLDGVRTGNPFTISAAGVEIKAEWSFMLGSCALYGLGATRAIKPGRHVLIFDEMLAQPTDFMLWLGDNVYLLNGEWKDVDRMYEKYTKVRLEPHTNAFLRSRPQYAILDDHDYGPDNAEGNFENKAATMACFRDFWPNPYFGAGDGEGTYYDFDYQDASFFMLDDRWFRNTVGNAQVIGPMQMAWLQAKLKASTATYKFIALGSQVVSEVNAHETWSRFPERQQLLDYIRAERIPGVIFLSGDRHFTELCKLEQPGLYPIYDFTSSPLSSIVRKRVVHPKDPEYAHALRVPGTKVVAHNFGKVVIDGPLGDRTCHLQTYDAYGKLLWSHDIPQKELGWRE